MELPIAAGGRGGSVLGNRYSLMGRAAAGSDKNTRKILGYEASLFDCSHIYRNGATGHGSPGLVYADK